MDPRAAVAMAARLESGANVGQEAASRDAFFDGERTRRSSMVRLPVPGRAHEHRHHDGEKWGGLHENEPGLIYLGMGTSPARARSRPVALQMSVRLHRGRSCLGGREHLGGRVATTPVQNGHRSAKQDRAA